MGGAQEVLTGRRRRSRSVPSAPHSPKRIGRAPAWHNVKFDGLSRVVKVVHRLTRHLRLEAQTGAQTSFDAFYSVEYD